MFRFLCGLRFVAPLSPLVVLAVLLISHGYLQVPLTEGASVRPLQKPGPPQSPAYRNAAPGVEFVGSKICAQCHQDVYEEFTKTDMGRSMRTTLPSDLEKVPQPVKVLAKELNRYFEVFRQNSDLYESEYQLDENGREVFRTTRKVEFIVGSGANGFTCIVQRGDYLFEAPLSFYTRANRWALSPGYEVRDYGFDRPIYEGCAVCHSGRARPVSGADGLYLNPPFEELAIGCENCHGPGELHVRERTEGAPVPLQRDSEIVNPAKLTPFLTDNICMYCHQAGDVRMLQPGKSYLDFRPGTPLDDTLAIFMIPLKREAPPQ